VKAALRVVHSATTIARQQQAEQRRQREAELRAQEEEAAAAAASTRDRDRDPEEFSPGSAAGPYDDFAPTGESKHSGEHAAAGSKVRPGGNNNNASAAAVEKVEILPFQALGNREFMSRIVAETHAGMAAIEESDALKLEIKQLEVS
jgi:hypothetical protein